jgi:hypothetical protein
VSEPVSIQNPILNIEPLHLDFGHFIPKSHLTQLPSRLLNITNIGEGVLIGRVVPQVSWLIISPVEFKCVPGQISVHKIQLSTGTPQPVTIKHYSYKELVFISSNGGDIFVDGEYNVISRKTGRKLEASWSMFILPVVVILFLVVIAISFYIIFNRQNSDFSPPDNNTSALYTQGAQTIITKLTQTAIEKSDSKYPLIIPTQTLSTQNTISLLGRSPSFEPSFTPWPRENFPNPEQFIIDYYSAINARDFDTSWAMLSKQFQQSCCKVGGNDPFLVYKNFWQNINRVEVLSAYLQEWNSNPARLIVSLRYYYIGGKSVESVYLYWLISDPTKSTLQIFEVK